MEAKTKTESSAYWWKAPRAESQVCPLPPKLGHLCPECGQGHLDYDGLFLLTCPLCGYVAESGVCT